MAEWWNTLSNFEKIYWVIALLFTIILVIQLITAFVIGVDTDAGTPDMDIDADGGIGMQFFTFRNMVGFFTIFGWVGIACIRADLSTWLVITLSVISGLIMMFLMAWIFFMLGKLQEDGSLNLKNAIGLVGEVYLVIGAKRSKIGKVQIKVQGVLRELDALTDEEEDLQFGNVIQVKNIINDQILLVEKFKN
jgi:hypothetical protein